MKTNELDYALPEELIAQEPPAARDGARLLVLDAAGDDPGGDLPDRAIEHRAIRELPRLLPPSLFIVNDTRVIPARLFGHKVHPVGPRGEAQPGGKVELLLMERLSPSGDPTGTEERWEAMGRSSKGLRPGQRVSLAEGAITGEVLASLGEGRVEVLLRRPGGGALEEAISEGGVLPLPPYIHRPAGPSDRARYQTLFAEEAGAIAAPTAGLHFSEALLSALEEAGHRLARLTLHVGIGTFRPVRAEDLREHRMHAERYAISEACAEAHSRARAEGRPIVAVGTTVVRTLESAADEAGRLRPASGRTELFITPPYRPRAFDHLLTNFHLPRSTLLALVMAVGGQEAVRRAYRAAVEERYRFFSYGDAMLIRKS